MSVEPSVIGLSGEAGAGKDAVAKLLVENHNYVRVAFADAVRDSVYALDPWIPAGELMGVQTYARLSKLVDHNGWEYTKRNYEEARRLLQTCGTELGRDVIGTDTWVNIGLRKADEAISKGRNVVYTDVRFPNEISAVHTLRGQVWRVERPNNPLKIEATHASEVGVAGLEDGILLNDGTLDDLKSYVERLALTPYTAGDVRDL